MPSQAEIDLTIDDHFKEEERLVMNYICVVVRLSKLSDALKVITEYEKKPNLSERAKAHLDQFRGTLALMCLDKNEDVQNHFNQAKIHYRKIGCMKGEAI